MSLIILGVGVVASGLVAHLTATPNNLTSLASSLVFWVSLAALSTYGLVGKQLDGLFDFRSRDLIWGLTLGLALRLFYGLTSGSDTHPFPTLQAGAGEVNLAGVILSVTISPLLEELVFRGVLLVCIYRLARTSFGALPSATVSICASAALFAAVHSIFAPQLFGDFAQFLLLGVASGTVVLLTGRIWGVVVLHYVYNLTFTVLQMGGYVLS